MVRPHSATPSFDSRLSVGLLPGLTSRQETPTHSNKLGAAIGDVYLEDPFVDRSQILQVGQRRSASTGVIGDNQILSSSAVLNSLGLGTDISSKTVRYSPSTTTLMDLIQEDYPRESHAIDPGSLYDNSTPVFQNEHTSYPHERPRTTSPLSSQYMREEYDYHYGRGRRDSRDQRSIAPSLNNGGANILDPMGRLNLDLGGETSYRANNNRGPVSSIELD